MAPAIFKIVEAPRRGVRWVRFPHALATLLLAAALITAPALYAQQPVPPIAPPSLDSIPDSLKKPPIAPRRAMLLSLILPGYSQSRLNRPTASVLFATAEVLAIGMARKAALDLREAKRARGDSVATTFTVDPNTGAVVPGNFVQNRLVARIGARHTHYEDWIAAIIFNHIISAADAYVAANLWDFKANVSLNPGSHTANVGGSLTF